MKRQAIMVLAASLLSVLILILGLLIGSGLSGRSSDSQTSMEAFSGSANEMQSAGSSGGIEIPGFENMVLKAGQRVQNVSFENPEENQCYFVIRILLPDSTEIYSSGMIAPGVKLSEIYLSKVPAEGKYPDSVLRYECFDLSDERNELNGAEVHFDLEVKE